MKSIKTTAYIMKKMILLSCCVLFLLPAFSQSGYIPSGLDGGKYTPKNSKDEKSKKKNNNSDGYQNLIGLSAGHLFRQMVVFSYERSLTSRFAVKGSIGYCFGKDLMTTYMSIDDNSFSGNELHKGVFKYSDENEFSQKTNYYFDATGKVYSNLMLADYYDVEYRFYVGLSIRNYKQTFLPLADDSTPANVTDLPIQNFGTSLVLGQMVYRESGASLEYYLGFGKLTTSYHGYTYNANSNRYVYDNDKTHLNKFLITIGILYGISF